VSEKAGASVREFVITPILEAEAAKWKGGSLISGDDPAHARILDRPEPLLERVENAKLSVHGTVQRGVPGPLRLVRGSRSATVEDSERQELAIVHVALSKERKRLGSHSAAECLELRTVQHERVSLGWWRHVVALLP